LLYPRIGSGQAPQIFPAFGMRLLRQRKMRYLTPKGSDAGDFTYQCP
jgi:hypothetical protein